MSADTVVIVGNPKENSRTRDAAERLATLLAGGREQTTLEVAPLGPALLGWGDPRVTEAKELIAGAKLAIFASPTFKASYTGLLKLLLDQFSGGTGLAGVTAVPLMLGGGAQHAMAVEHTLRPVLTELGALALPGLFLIDETYQDDGEIEAYAERWGETVQRLLAPSSAD